MARAWTSRERPSIPGGRAKIHRPRGRTERAMRPPMICDELRFVLALARAGSLPRAARDLKVDHTTVGGRIEAVEAALGVALFTRTTTGYVLTAEAEGLLPGITHVEDAVLALERGAHARH